MFGHLKQTTKYEDLTCMLEKVKLINDVFTFNSTLSMGKKYAVWLEKHQNLVDELEFMINEDLEVYNKKA